MKCVLHNIAIPLESGDPFDFERTIEYYPNYVRHALRTGYTPYSIQGFVCWLDKQVKKNIGIEGALSSWMIMVGFDHIRKTFEYNSEYLKSCLGNDCCENRTQ